MIAMFRFQKKSLKIAVGVPILRNWQKGMISHCSFAEDGKGMYKVLKLRCPAIVMFIRPVFRHLLVIIAV